MKIKNIGFLLFGLLFLCSCGTHQKESASSLEQNNSSITERTQCKTTESTREMKNKVASYVVTYKNLDEIETASDLVVKVTALDSEELCFNQPDIDNGVFPMGYVLTSVRIDAVYKSNDVVKVGDVLKIEEYYTTSLNPENNATIINSYGFYCPMVKEHQYILFLQKPQNTGDYEIVRFDLGKYAINDAISTSDDIRKLSCEELEIYSQDNRIQRIPSEYFDIAEQVKKKYN